MLVAIFKRDVANFSDYSTNLDHSYLNKIACSDHIHETNRDKEILRINKTINAMESCMNTPDCMTAEEIRSVTTHNAHLTRHLVDSSAIKGK